MVTEIILCSTGHSLTISRRKSKSGSASTASLLRAWQGGARPREHRSQLALSVLGLCWRSASERTCERLAGCCSPGAMQRRRPSRSARPRRAPSISLCTQPATRLSSRGWCCWACGQGGSSHTSGGTPAAIRPTSSSACIIFLMRAAGKRGLSPFGGMSQEGEGARAGATPPRRRGGRDRTIPTSHPLLTHPLPFTFTLSLSLTLHPPRTTRADYAHRKTCST